jgi:hypothetical protein
MAENLSESQIAEFKEAFALFVCHSLPSLSPFACGRASPAVVESITNKDASAFLFSRTRTVMVSPPCIAVTARVLLI